MPHFAYAFAFTGGSLVMFLDGVSPFSLDHWLRNKKPSRPFNHAVKTVPAG
jgi:hypothetical protein